MATTLLLSRKLATAREEVREAYRNGATLRQIAEVYSVSSGTVRHALIEMGETLRSRGRRKKADTVNPNIVQLESPVENPIQRETSTVGAARIEEPEVPSRYEGGLF